MAVAALPIRGMICENGFRNSIYIGPTPSCTGVADKEIFYESIIGE